MYTSFTFCNWYFIAHSIPLNFNVNSTCLKNIKAWHSQIKETGSTRLPRLDEVEHREDSEDEEPREDTDVATISLEQPEVLVATDLVPPPTVGS